MSDRRVICVDVETTGLDLIRHRPVEVAYLGWRCGGHGVFIPPHSLKDADDEALRITRYAQRIAFKGHGHWDHKYERTRELHTLLQGATLAGANVRFDAAMLGHLFRAARLDPEPWHYRLLDVQAYAAGSLGMQPWQLPSLRELVEVLDVPNRPDHTAFADCMAVSSVLDALVPGERSPWPLINAREKVRRGP